MTRIADLIPKIWTPKNVLRYLSKKSPFKGPLTGNMVKGPKYYCNMNDSTATLFIAYSEGNLVGKSVH